MIFNAPRFIVIDDNGQHLKSITDTLNSLGVASLGIQYDPENELKKEKEYFRGVRCLFMDLHLDGDQIGSDEKRIFTIIAAILDDNIHENGGPYVLVIWTQHAHLSDDLKSYLDNNLDPAKPYTRPLAVLYIDKKEVIDIDNGVPEDPEDFKKKVMDIITTIPQLSALLSWEADVLSASAETLSSLINLVPSEKRKSPTFANELDSVLSLLAREAVGKDNVDSDPRVAIYRVLSPMLYDRIMIQKVTKDMQEIWKSAVTRYAARKINAVSPSERGNMNRMLHFDVPGSVNIKPTEWGAVVAWPFDKDDECMKGKLGLTMEKLMGDEFKLLNESMKVCTPVLVRVGAACDYAQNKTGPITYYFGLEIPESAYRRGGKKDKPVKLSDAIWVSPVYLLPEAGENSKLFVHIRFPITVLPSDCPDWKVRFRMREQILMHLISNASHYNSRPGIIQLRT